MKTRIVVILITLVCAAIASVPNARAATITVQDTTDDGTANAANCSPPSSACRLRDALAAASTTAVDTIDASGVSGTISLVGELLVDRSVTIEGPSGASLAVNGGLATRVFQIVGVTVAISNLTITRGLASGTYPNDSGGGIYNHSGTLTITNCTISDNDAGYGGGIYNDTLDSGPATLTIINSTLSGNTATYDGGGIYDQGIYSSANLTIENSTLSGNSATSGGGIYHHNSTSGGVTINNSTLSDNDGDGIYYYNEHPGWPYLTIGSTILYAGTTGDPNIVNAAEPTISSDGYNLCSDNGGGYLTATGDQVSVTYLGLAPLGYNGGLTQTHALCTAYGVPDPSCTGTSPAIDAGKNFSGSTTDERGTGFPRTNDDLAIPNASGGDGTDIGAYEAPTATPTPTATATFTPTATATFTPTATATFTSTATATFTPTATATFTPTPTATFTPTPTPTFTPTPTPTSTPTATATATATATPTPTPTPPLAPAAPINQKATNVTASSFTANWRSVALATGYKLDVSTSDLFGTFLPGYHDRDVGNTTSRDLAGLTANTFYYYRVRAYNTSGTSPNSGITRIKTKPH